MYWAVFDPFFDPGGCRVDGPLGSWLKDAAAVFVLASRRKLGQVMNKVVLQRIVGRMKRGVYLQADSKGLRLLLDHRCAYGTCSASLRLSSSIHVAVEAAAGQAAAGLYTRTVR